MTLPGTDPYKLGDPLFTGLGTSNEEINGIPYNRQFIITNGTIFTKFIMMDQAPPNYTQALPARFFRAFGFHTISGFYKYSGYYHLYFDPLYSGAEYWVVNPLTYIRTSPANILLGVIHWAHAIPEANIDVSSFTAVDSWCSANSILRSVVFFGDTTISIIKKLCEQSGQLFIYVNAQEQVACGYLNHEPSDTPDWTINSGEYHRIIKFGEMRTRKVPGIVTWGWHSEDQSCQAPKFGLFKKDITNFTTQKEMVLEEPYEAKYVDNYMSDTGTYEDFSSYVELEMEVGTIIFLLDLDEIVQVNEVLLALGIDSDFQDNFRVHKLIIDCEQMTGIVGLIKRKTWNII